MNTRLAAEIAVQYSGSVTAAMVSANTTLLVYFQLSEMLITSHKYSYKLSKGDRIRNPYNHRERYIVIGGGFVVDLKTGINWRLMDLTNYPLEIYRYVRS